MFRIRALRAFVAMIVVVALGACAGTQHKSAKAETASQPVVAKRGDAKGYRFNMTQHGRKMSAEDFDAWMRANGLHVAKGKAKPAARERHQDRRQGKARVQAGEGRRDDGREKAVARLTGRRPLAAAILRLRSRPVRGRFG
ncbi:hypothetical protein H1235_13105 [Pseudoxanthomonas sp. NC8]|nr:hypothetical protein H1235_13105 [Pseudoxanthomonas sp. NC8]